MTMTTKAAAQERVENAAEELQEALRERAEELVEQWEEVKEEARADRDEVVRANRRLPKLEAKLEEGRRKAQDLPARVYAANKLGQEEKQPS